MINETSIAFYFLHGKCNLRNLNNYADFTSVFPSVYTVAPLVLVPVLPGHQFNLTFREFQKEPLNLWKILITCRLKRVWAQLNFLTSLFHHACRSGGSIITMLRKELYLHSFWWWSSYHITRWRKLEVTPQCATSSNWKKIKKSFEMQEHNLSMRNFLPSKRNLASFKGFLIGGSYTHNTRLPPIEKKDCKSRKFFLDGGSYPTMHDFLQSDKINCKFQNIQKVGSKYTVPKFYGLRGISDLFVIMRVCHTSSHS